MIIRRLTKEDKFEAYLLSAFCFHSRVDDVEAEREKEESNTDEDWGAFTEDDVLTSRIINNKFNFYVDGTPVRTGGIGAVSTLPEYRNLGGVKEIFHKLLPEAYKDGEVISALYPFNESFYRKQGYETVTFQNSYELAPAVLECYKTDCDVTMWHTGDAVDEYVKVYNEFAKNYNCAMPRDEKSMLEHMKYDAIYKDRKFTYLFSKDGISLAYLTFTDVYHNPAAILHVEELAWVNREGFEAILAFLGRFDADYGSIELLLPAGIDLFRIVRTRRAYDIKKTTCHGFMVRVINAEKLLGVIKKPEGCDFTISISDEIIAENNGVWRVTSDSVQLLGAADGAGKAASGGDTASGGDSASGGRTASAGLVADLEVSERTFAQMAVGAISLDEAVLKPDVKVNSKEDMLRRVFTEKKILCFEHF